MDIKEFFAEFDKMAQTMDDPDLEAVLVDACHRFANEEPSDSRGLAAMYNELGSFYRARNRFESGEQAFIRAKQILEADRLQCNSVACCSCAAATIDMVPEKDRNWTHTADYATILNNLAGLYRMWHRPERALPIFEKAETIYAQLENIPADVVASCSNNKGLAYLELKDSKSAMSCFEDAMAKIANLENNDIMFATTMSNMAFAHAIAGEFAAAMEKFQKASEMFRTCSNPDPDMAKYCKAMAERAADRMEHQA